MDPEKMQPRIKTSGNRTEAWGLTLCPRCGQPVLMVFETDFETLKWIGKTPRTGDVFRQEKAVFKLTEVFPAPPSPSARPDWPDKVQTAIQDADSGIQSGQSAMAIMSACGAALEQGLKALEAKGKSSFAMIEDLHKKGIVTDAVAKWAHDVRVVRNTAVHDYEATMDEALESFEFLKLFFRLVFTLPAEIERKSATKSE